MEHKAAANGQKSSAPKRSFNFAKPVTYASIPTHPLVHPRAKLSTQRVGQFLQPKLKIGQPNDKYEQQADWVAAAVKRIPAPSIQTKQTRPFKQGPLCGDMGKVEEPIRTKTVTDQITPPVQTQLHELPEEAGEFVSVPTEVATETEPIPDEDREVKEPEDMEAEFALTKKADGKFIQAGQRLEAQIRTMRATGQPLPKPVRDYFEPRFGYDFSRVRVNTDAKSNEIAKDLNAWAFTTGKNIIFRASQYKPDTEEGKKLLAHELTHVAQQNGSRIPGNTIQRTVSRRSSCRPNVHGAPNAPLKALRWIDANAQTMTLNCMYLLFKEAKACQFRGDAYVPSNVYTTYRKWFGLPTQTRRRRWRSRFRRRTFSTQRKAVVNELYGFSRRFYRLHKYLKYRIRYFCPGRTRWFTLRGCKGTRCRGSDAVSCYRRWSIAICPNFWTTTSNNLYRASLISHEASHIFWDTKDRGHGSAKQRLRNAYCIDGFIYELHRGSVTYSQCPKIP